MRCGQPTISNLILIAVSTSHNRSDRSKARERLGRLLVPELLQSVLELDHLVAVLFVQRHTLRKQTCQEEIQSSRHVNDKLSVPEVDVLCWGQSRRRCSSAMAARRSSLLSWMAFMPLEKPVAPDNARGGDEVVMGRMQCC